MAQRVARVRRRVHVEPLLGQRLCHELAEQRFVFNKQDSRFLFHNVTLRHANDATAEMFRHCRKLPDDTVSETLAGTLPFRFHTNSTTSVRWPAATTCCSD